MKLSSFRGIGHTAAHGAIFGLSAAFTIAIVSLVYAATTYYTDLPTVSSGSGLTATSWNNLVDYANKAVKQDTEVLTVTGGKVGIGTTAPTNILSVNGNIDASRFAINAAGTAPSNGMFAPIGNTIGFSVGGTEQVRITPSGNVGIGTSSPNEKLEVNGNIKFTSDGSIISKAPRSVHSTDPIAGCPPARAANTDLWTMPFVLSRTSTVLLSGDSIKNSTVRSDLLLYVDGIFLMQTIAPGVVNDWAGAHVQWTGTLGPGNHVLSLRSPQANVWGC